MLIWLNYFLAGSDGEVQGEGHGVLRVCNFRLRGVHADRAPFPRRMIGMWGFRAELNNAGE